MSDQDLVHLRHLYFPESKDIDLFRFELSALPGRPDADGRLTIETMAERQLQSSLLDTVLTLWRAKPDGSYELLARNDNYFGRDSYLELDLGPGVYYVGVSASGNDEYDPIIEDSGFGGTTQGEYELRLNYRPDAAKAISDADNPNNAADLPGRRRRRGSGRRVQFLVPRPRRRSRDDVCRQVGGQRRHGHADGPLQQSARRRLTAAQAGPDRAHRGHARPGRQDRDADGQPTYQIGFNSLGAALPDGSTLEIPRGVTMMVDAGAVFQMRRARIGVGSSSAGIDRSGGALQVLGAPILLTDSNGNGSFDIGDAAVQNANGTRAAGSVYFTSYNDQTIGLDTNPFITTPANGDWGGIEFRSDVDRTQGYFQWADEGIFLNYVNHADIRYGGGNVLINSVSRTINPIHITDARPTVTYNTISRSADASMSASPDSFEETNFHAPRYQRIAFTSDYARIGPEIHHNQLINNSVNGLFVRVGTEAGSSAQKLNVSGRWNETDIVHVMSENLAIASQPGGAFDRSTPPPVALVIQTAVTDGSTTGGSLGSVGTDTKYTYKLTYVDRFGFESPASTGMTKAITAANVAGKQRSMKFTQLPAAPDPYVARRLYRSENDGPFVFVAQLDRQGTVYVDSGKSRGGVLQLPPIGAVTLTPQLGGTLTPGSYSYRVTFVDAIGKESRASDASVRVTLDGNPTELGLPGRGAVLLDRLPVPQASGNYVARRIYRSSETGSAPYQLVAEIDTTSASFLDDGTTDPTAVLDDSIQLGRPNGRLEIDPSIVVKLDGARFELELGAQMIAEGDDGREIIFTSIADDRYGAGGTFDTGNDGAVISGSSNDPQAGDWGGIYGGHLSNLNLDHAVFAYGGGVTRVEGTFTAFNVVEIMDHAEARIANSVFEFNARGQGGQGEVNRFGRGFNEPGVIFVRQAQPVIYNNIFRNNPDDDPNTRQTNPNLATPAININVNALNYVYKRDTGRTTGPIDRLEGYRDNQGPLILDNQLDDNEINGMVVRGQTLTTQSVWDDTDIVHVLFDTVYVSDFHSFGGLVLASSPTESLVVKLLARGSSVLWPTAFRTRSTTASAASFRCWASPARPLC